MRAAVYYGRNDVRVESFKDPGPLGPGEVRLRVVRAALCGTDAGEFAHGPRMIPIHAPHPGSGHCGPTIIGHEFVGRVDAVGTDVGSVAIDQRVVPGAGMWCGDCRWCEAGRTNLCENYYTLGLNSHGGMAEYVNVPEQMCLPVPEDCTDDAASIAQPLAVALHALRRGQISTADSVVVVGVGGIGLMLIAAAAAIGASPLVAIDVNRDRLASARTVGATFSVDASKAEPDDLVRSVVGAAGADLVVEASGTPMGLHTAQKLVRRGGTILVVGIQAEPTALDFADLTVREVNLVATNAHVCMVDLPEALDVLGNQGLAEAAIDRVVPLDAIVEQGLVPLAKGQVSGKILVDIQHVMGTSRSTTISNREKMK